MTFNAQTFVASAAQIVFELGAVTWIMARAAVHRFAIARVMSFVPGGVAEVTVVFVAANAGMITILLFVALGHGRHSGAVKLMAVDTVTRLGMEVQTAAATLKFSGVAATTCFAGIASH